MENMHTDVRGYRVKDLFWHAVRTGEYGRYVLVKNLKQVRQPQYSGFSRFIDCTSLSTTSRTRISHHNRHTTFSDNQILHQKWRRFYHHFTFRLINPFSSINRTFSVKRGIEGKSILAVFPPLWNDLYGYMEIQL